jgi:hypothetical protein
VIDPRNAQQLPAIGSWTQCPAPSQPSVVQTSKSSHASCAGVQTPAWHVPSGTHASGSRHGASSPCTLGGVHAPVRGSQSDASAQAVASAHTVGVPPTHTSSWQWSPVVQALASSHGVPSGAP